MARDFKRLLHPHYLMNFTLCISFLFLKIVPPICDYAFPQDECRLNWDDCNIYLFLGCVLVVKNRRSNDWLEYISTSFLFAKIANNVLFMKADPRWGTLYGIACLMSFVVFPEPAYAGPDNILYFSESTLKEELEKDRKGYWLVEFYAGWSPPCVRFASVFAELSLKYSNDFLRFGKINIGTSPDTAKQYYVDISSMTKQLPTVILFHQGKEKTRVPVWDSKGKIVKYPFDESNLIYDFDLNNIHQETLKLCKDKKSKKKEEIPVKTEEEKKKD
ncbi:thioredoxin-related transmembrane protein 2-A-like [Glandiceps talaboti]